MKKSVCDTCNYIANNHNERMEHYHKTRHNSFTAKWVTSDGKIEGLERP